MGHNTLFKANLALVLVALLLVCKQQSYVAPNLRDIFLKDGASTSVTQYDCLRRSRPIVVDGKLNEWQSLPYAIPGKNAVWCSVNNHPQRTCVAHFDVGYDDQFLYIAIRAIDPVVISDPLKEPWQQDGIEVRLDARTDPARSHYGGSWSLYDPNILTILLIPAHSPDKSVLVDRELLHVPSGTRAACIITRRGYNAEIAIPISYLNQRQGGEWQAFRLNVTVDDKGSPDSPVVQYSWCPDWRTPNNYTGSGTFLRN